MLKLVEVPLEIVALVLFKLVRFPVLPVIWSVEILVEVELVIVPLVTLIEGRDKLVTERLVIVAADKVAFPPWILAVLS